LGKSLLLQVATFAILRFGILWQRPTPGFRPKPFASFWSAASRRRTLDDIAEAADVSRRSLFHYFESKEEIVLSARADFPNIIAEAIGRLTSPFWTWSRTR
jgi:hypothetical protein